MYAIMVGEGANVTKTIVTMGQENFIVKPRTALFLVLEIYCVIGSMLFKLTCLAEGVKYRGC